MEKVAIIDEGTAVVLGNQLKLENKENESSVCNAPKKGLRDLTNLQQQPKVSKKGGKLQLQPALRSKDYIDKLQQENMTLMKVLVDRNKVIDSTGIELQKLRINLEKFQQQNSLLAQANSHMLADLNSGKDMLNALKHELGCKNALLKTIKSEVRTNKCDKADVSFKEEDGENKPCNMNSCSKAGESLEELDGENKLCHTNRRRQSESLCPSNIKSAEAKKGVDDKRVFIRRQSTRFKAQESKLTKDDFDDDAKFIVSSSCDDKVDQNGQSSTDSSVENVHEEENIDNKRRVHLRRQSARFKAQEPKLIGDTLDVHHAEFLVSSSCGEKGHESGQASSDLSVKKEHEEGCINKKRVCLRRQSARFKSMEPESIEDAFNIDDMKLLASSSGDDKVHESGPMSSDSSIKKEVEEGIITSRNEAPELRRTSIGRPLRQAVGKVQSYRELPLNIKMRRE